jgi:hypothetical protein
MTTRARRESVHNRVDAILQAVKNGLVTIEHCEEDRQHGNQAVAHGPPRRRLGHQRATQIASASDMRSAMKTNACL